MPTLKIYITVTVAAENEHSVRGNGVRMVSVVVCVAFYASSQRVPSVVSVARVCSVGRSALRSQPERLSLSLDFFLFFPVAAREEHMRLPQYEDYPRLKKEERKREDYDNF